MFSEDFVVFGLQLWMAQEYSVSQKSVLRFGFVD